MKTKEELNALKEEVEAGKFHDLTEDELENVTGGSIDDPLKKLQDRMKIDGGNDNSGGYQIDEKIREKIRQGTDPYQKGDIQRK